MHDERFFESGNESGDSFEMESVAPDDESEVENGSVVDPAGESEPQKGCFGAFFTYLFPGPFFAYLRRDRNWVDLFATSVNWMLLDFTFYLLGVNSSSFVPILFGENNGPDRPAYSLLIDEERHIMESSSVGALLGSLAAIIIMFLRSSRPFLRNFNSPRKLQMWGFVSLAPLFVIVGALYVTLPRTRAYVAIVFFYQLCNLFFNLGGFLIHPSYSLNADPWAPRSEHDHFHGEWYKSSSHITPILMRCAIDPSTSLPNTIQVHLLRNISRYGQTWQRAWANRCHKGAGQQWSRRNYDRVVQLKAMFM